MWGQQLPPEANANGTAMRTGRWLVDGDTASSSNNGARARLGCDDCEHWDDAGPHCTQAAENAGDFGSGAGRMVPASVEQVALSHYLQSGWSVGIHSENSIPLTFFGLLLWDALFAPVPGQLCSAVQDAPVDLWDARRFYERRRLQIDETLGRVRAGQAVQLLHAAHAAHWGAPVVGVTWGRFSLGLLCDVANGLGGAAVAGICAALANDYTCWSHGFPDLLLLEPGRPTAQLCPCHGGDAVPSSGGFSSGCGAAAGKPSEARVKLVEVKGPGDRLSDAQVAWIGLLLKHGVQVEVCRVKPGR